MILMIIYRQGEVQIYVLSMLGKLYFEKSFCNWRFLQSLLYPLSPSLSLGNCIWKVRSKCLADVLPSLGMYKEGLTFQVSVFSYSWRNIWSFNYFVYSSILDFGLYISNYKQIRTETLFLNYVENPWFERTSYK